LGQSCIDNAPIPAAVGQKQKHRHHFAYQENIKKLADCVRTSGANCWLSLMKRASSCTRAACPGKMGTGYSSLDDAGKFKGIFTRLMVPCWNRRRIDRNATQNAPNSAKIHPTLGHLQNRTWFDSPKKCVAPLRCAVTKNRYH